MRFIRSMCAVAFVSLSLSVPALAEDAGSSVKAAKAEVCEHGVKKSICSRCNPKLEAVYKSKGDWCDEHARAESQCVLCNPELAKKGVKP